MVELIKCNYCVIIFLICVKLSVQNYTYEINFINVPVDHFSFANNDSFKLRYLINDSYWNNDGPIFFYTGNEGDIETFAQNTGFMWDIALEFEALLVFAEHRYYGESMPYGNKSFSEAKYLGYLTSSQALADFVFLIDYIQKAKKYYDNGDKNPVIVFGGSYGGMLAAWMRMKYPSFVQGAIASSAPIYQFQGITPCEAYARIVTSAFRVSSTSDCTKIIGRSWATLREVTQTDDGKAWLSSNWKLCKPLKTNDDINMLRDWIESIFSDLAMVNYPYPTDFLAPLPGYPVRAVCNRLYDTSLKGKQLLEALGNALAIYTNYTGTTKCVNIDSSMSSALGEQGWDFQACTEMVMPMCSDENDMFENEKWNFSLYSDECYRKWKIRVTRPDLAILQYGGKNIEAASNIIFSNGLLDPWSSGGVLHNISKTVFAILIPDAAHHLDLRASNPADPPSVVHARNFHKRAIRGWLRSFYGRDYMYYYY